MIPGTDWFPWNEVHEEDRGYGTVCWIWPWPEGSLSETVGVNIRKKAKRLFKEFVGEKRPGQLWMHLCERYGEPNLCVRPDHVVFGTKSTNQAHYHALRRAAGVPPATEKRRGFKNTEETKALMSRSARAKRESERAAGPYVCEACGREFGIPSTRTRHQRVGCVKT